MKTLEHLRDHRATRGSGTVNLQANAPCQRLEPGFCFFFCFFNTMPYCQVSSHSALVDIR